MEETQIKNHILSCPSFAGIALKKVTSIYKGLSISELKVLLAELQLCQEMVSDQIQEKQIRSSVSKSVIPKINIVSNINQEKVSCNRCKKELTSNLDLQSLFYVEECWHLFCISCVWKYINEQFVNNLGQLRCMAPNCKKKIKEAQLRSLMKEKYDEMYAKAIRKMGNIVECIKCRAQFEFLPGNPNHAPKKDSKGKELNSKQKKHFAQNRFICPISQCKTQQCKQCGANPYHLGFTCEQHKKDCQMKKCRYCEKPITQHNRSKTNVAALADICTEKQCQELAETACTKMLPCGHPCSGVKGEKKCLPCLKESCINPSKMKDQKGDDYCNICFVESLEASPCIKCECGHIFHEKCLKKRYQVRWLTPRVFFNFCLCPLCKVWLSFPDQSRLQKYSMLNSDLYYKIQKMSLDRLKFEELQKDERLTNPQSAYYKKPTEYAMAIYAYFQCWKCKNPYFGGRKDCADAMNEAQNQVDFNSKELVCPNCCQIPLEKCPKHGTDEIQFKCKFCCSVAQWFCWGTTHFCDSCHKRQCKGDYLTKYPKSKLPKCPGAGKCPVGGNHGENGYEKSLGCALCRNYKENHKNF